MKSRGIDHAVVCVESLEQAKAEWEALGFTTTPIAKHPFGTVNSLVQLDGNFVELLAIGDHDAITESSATHLSFAAYNRDWMQDGEGMSMLVLEGHDSRADVAEFRSAGIKTFEPFDFERLATLPNGEKHTVGFSLAFAFAPEMPRAAFFTCHQHAPQYFWKSEYQRHNNGAKQIVETVMVDPEPVRRREFFAKLQDESSVSGTDDALRVKTARGCISVLSPADWEDRYPGVQVDTTKGPVFAALVLRADINRLGADVPTVAGRRWLSLRGLVVEFVA